MDALELINTVEVSETYYMTKTTEFRWFIGKSSNPKLSYGAILQQKVTLYSPETGKISEEWRNVPTVTEE